MRLQRWFAGVLQEKRRGWRLFYVVLLSMLLAWIVLLLFYAGYRCPVRALIGYPCPGCGMTTAFVRLLRGDFQGAFAANPMFLPVLAVYLALVIGYAAGKLHLFRTRAFQIAGLFLLFCCFLYWLIGVFSGRYDALWNPGAVIPRLFT